MAPWKNMFANIEREGVTTMGMDDKIKNAAAESVGRVKEGVGAATDNKDLENEGKVDRAKADARQAGEKVKDAVRDATN